MCKGLQAAEELKNSLPRERPQGPRQTRPATSGRGSRKGPGEPECCGGQPGETESIRNRGAVCGVRKIRKERSSFPEEAEAEALAAPGEVEGGGGWRGGGVEGL